VTVSIVIFGSAGSPSTRPVRARSRILTGKLYLTNVGLAPPTVFCRDTGGNGGRCPPYEDRKIAFPDTPSADDQPLPRRGDRQRFAKLLLDDLKGLGPLLIIELLARIDEGKQARQGVISPEE
jgi:hypothetical protein